MKIFSKRLSIGLAKVILVILLIATSILAYLFFTGELSSKWTVLYGGLVTGLIVAIVQLLLDWYEHKEIEKFKLLGISRIIPHRDDEAYYRGLIKGATKKIDVLGVTANRFMADFADSSRGRAEKKVLIDALARSVAVRILVPQKSFLDHKDHDAFEQALGFFKTVRKTFGNFEYAYFSHIPAHSIVLVDDDCLLGPVFPLISSKDTPCIQMNTQSPFANSYLKYFEEEWNKADKQN